MRNHLKKLVAVFLVAIMALSIAPFTGLFIVANAETVNGTCGGNVDGLNLTWTFDDSSNTLTIAGTGKMKDYAKASAAPWYNYHYGTGNSKTIKVESIEIGAGVTSIGNFAFASCASLSGVNFAAGSALTKIGGYAFFGCTKLTGITLPAGVTAIGACAFSASGLTSFNVPAGVTTLSSGTFENCKSLTEVTFADGSVLTTVIDWVFNGCSSLESVVLPAGVTAVGDYAFTDCSSATTISLPAGLLTLGKLTFKGCTDLVSVNLPDGITSIGDDYFADCSSLESILVPAGVTAIGARAFKNCTSLQTLTIAAGSNLSTIGAEAFYNCSKLTGIAIPASVISIGLVTETDYYHVFDLCTSLESITVDSANANYSSDASGVLYNKAQTVLIKFPASSAATAYTISKDVTEIKAYAFESCKNLQTITVEADNANYKSDRYGALYNKDGSVLIQYPSGNTATSYVILSSAVTIKSRAFSDCANLTTYVHVPTTVKTAGFSTDSFVNLPEGCVFCCDDPEQRDIQVYAVSIGHNYSKCNNHCVHDYKEISRIDSTCYKTGTKTLMCTLCGDVKEQVIAKKNHTFGEPVIVEATCSHPGSSTVTCTVDGCGYQEVTPITVPHTYVVNAAESVTPTCTDPGKTVSICSVCQNRNEEVVPALGHSFGEWIVDSNNTYGVAGSRHHICSVCSVSTTENLPALPIVTMNPAEVTTAVYKESTFDLTCSVQYLGNFAIQWVCSDPDVATVVQDPFDATKCTVTAIGNGKITVTAKAVTSSGEDITDGYGTVIDCSSSIECKAQMTFWQQIVKFFRGIFAKFSLGNLIG